MNFFFLHCPNPYYLEKLPSGRIVIARVVSVKSLFFTVRKYFRFLISHCLLIKKLFSHADYNTNQIKSRLKNNVSKRV